MLLGWEGVEIVGITTNLDADASRAGCVQHYLKLSGRTDTPVAAGESMTTGRRFDETTYDLRHWPQLIPPAP